MSDSEIKDFFLASNAISDAKRGWFLGQFVPECEGLRHQTAVELKWGIHPAGETRTAWVYYKESTTVVIALKGRFLLRVRKDAVAADHVLENPGDYVVMAPDLRHVWKALTDCTILSVRFPSVAGDQFEEENVPYPIIGPRLSPGAQG